MEPGALRGDEYCQIFLSVDMGDCNGCPDYTRRIEVYSNKDIGCGSEFVNTDNNNDNDIDNGDENDENNDEGNSGGGTLPPIEERASQMIIRSSVFAAAATLTLF